MARPGKQNAAMLAAMSAPDWKAVRPDGQFANGRTYKDALWSALYYVHYEVKYPSRAKSYIWYAEKTFGKQRAKNLRFLPDSEFVSPGKLTYVAYKGGVLDDAAQAQVACSMERLEQRAARIAAERAAEARACKQEAEKKATGPTFTIQQRMHQQIEELGGNIEEAIDQWMLGRLPVKDFDPYAMIRSYQPEVKAQQAKILRGYFERAVKEAQLVAEFKDRDIREAYSHLSARQRKEMQEIYQKVISACDTVVNAKKATRKTRVKKPADKNKQVARLKFKPAEAALGLASINPIEIIGASELWVYDTKTRKLGAYRAAADAGSLGVKGTTILGFDEATSTAKTVRKPAEVLRGAGKLTKPRFNRVFGELKTAETRLKSRLSDNIVLVKAFK
jgi:hypothetical protein